MELVVLFVSLGLLVSVAAVLVAHWPRGRRTLDQARLSRFFHGLILFGRDGSHIYLNGPTAKDRIVFTKYMDGEPPYWIEVLIAGLAVPETFGDDVASGLEMLGGRFAWKALDRSSDPDRALYSLSGSGLQDPAALESVARLIVRCIGHSASTRFRIDFEGPKDREAVDEYFGFRR